MFLIQPIDIHLCYIDAFVVFTRFVAELKSDPQYKLDDQISESLHRYKKLFTKKDNNKTKESSKREIIFTEMIVRFQREFNVKRSSDWNVAKFKVVTFEILSV